MQTWILKINRIILDHLTDNINDANYYGITVKFLIELFHT